jgi:uncharacterized protein (DUF305 family)
MRRPVRALVTVGAVALAVVGLAGCGGGADGDSETATPAGASAVPFDRAFIDAVVPHHQSAIEMAEAAKAAGLSQPELIEIADNIISSQQAEIDQMLDWREEWYGSRKLDPEGPDALGLSEAQMGVMEHAADDIRKADDVDAAFAEMMIEHHQGAITMASLALDRGQHDEIKNLAQAIIDAQKAEIEIMRKHAEGEHA